MCSAHPHAIRDGADIDRRLPSRGVSQNSMRLVLVQIVETTPQAPHITCLILSGQHSIPYLRYSRLFSHYHRRCANCPFLIFLR